jgi:sugar lactone lactonase YvrE
LYNVSSKSLAPRPIVDKREANEPMNGVRGDSVADTRGSYVFTVYARAEGPFVHALPLQQPFAWCVDLPAQAGASLEDQFHWSLAMSNDGTAIYAVNATTGQIAQLSTSGSPNPPVVSRVGKLPLGSQTSLLSLFATDADAKGAPLGGAALSSDGRTLFAAGNPGVLAIDTSTLKVRARYLPDDNIPSIRLSADGKWLYAADPGVNTVWQLDPASGTVKGQIKNIDSPWAVLWVAPR